MEYFAVQTLTYVKSHLADPLTLKALAARAHMSPASFGPRFKRATGQTAYQAILHARLMQAQLLLRTTRATIVSIAWAVGFHNHSHFTHLFRQRFGLTPEAYRWQAHQTTTVDTLTVVMALWPRLGPEQQADLLAQMEAAVAGHGAV